VGKLMLIEFTAQGARFVLSAVMLRAEEMDRAASGNNRAYQSAEHRRELWFAAARLAHELGEDVSVVTEYRANGYRANSQRRVGAEP
jgi:hypothetical protein